VPPWLGWETISCEKTQGTSVSLTLRRRLPVNSQQLTVNSGFVPTTVYCLLITVYRRWSPAPW